MREVIRTFASAVAKEPVSESWVTRFINKYTIDLVSLYSTGMNTDRHNADSYLKYKPYFDLLRAKIDGYNYILGIPEVLQYAEVRGDITSISSDSICHSTLLDTRPAERCKDWGTRGNQPTWGRTRYSDWQGWSLSTTRSYGRRAMWEETPQQVSKVAQPHCTASDLVKVEMYRYRSN
jgi:hypothetical protein